MAKYGLALACYDFEQVSIIFYEHRTFASLELISPRCFMLGQKGENRTNENILINLSR